MPEQPLEKEYVERYKEADAGWSNYLHEAEVDTQMVLGAQHKESDVNFARFHGRALMTFNRMMRQVNLISGYEIRNRHSLKIGPVGEEDDVAARQHTALVANQMTQAEGYEFLSQAFRWGTLVSGSNLVELWRDRHGDMQFHRRGYCGFLLDPMLSRPDLTDCGYILAGQWLRDSAIKQLVPENADRIKGSHQAAGHPRWPRMPGRPEGANDVDPTRLYEEYWRQGTTFKKHVIDRTTGVEMPWRDFVTQYVRGDLRRANYIAANLRLRDGQPAFSKFSVPHRRVRLSLYVDNHLIWDGDNPLGFTEYPFVWLSGDWLPEMDRDDLKLQSFARILRDPQHARNKRLNQVCDILESQITNLRVVREGTLVDEKEAYRSGPTVVRVTDKYQGDLLQAFQQLPGPGLPAGVFQLLEVLDREDVHAGGLNEEIFGSDDNEIPGVLHRYRTGQALTGQQGMFANYRQAKRRLGRLMVLFNQANMGPKRLARLLRQGHAPDFYVPDLVRYDCTPTEGLLTADQQQLWYMELRELAAMYPQLIPASEVLKAAPVAYPQKLLEIIRRSEQQQAQIAQMQVQNQAIMNQLIAAQSQVDLARAQQEIAAADEDRAGALLDRTKAMVEAGKIQDSRGLEVVDRAIRIGEIQAKMQVAREQARQRTQRTQKP
jgi:hypothetical protein